MKKRIKYISIVFLMLIFCSKVEAFSVSKNILTINEGESETVELYADVGDNSVNKIVFLFVRDSYDVATTFNPVGGINDSHGNTSTHTLTFNEAKTGRILLGTIIVSVHKNPAIIATEARAMNGVATTTDGESINLKLARINININKVTPTTNNNETAITTTTTTTTTTKVIDNTTTKTTTTTVPKSTTTTTTTTSTTTKVRENKGLLKNIESKIVKINLEDDVFEYTVNVYDTLDELDLEPIANDENTKIEISNQKISELEDKQIVINLSNKDIKEKYVIKVNVVPKPTVAPIEIDNKNFVEKHSYKGKWIVAIVFLGIVLTLSVLLLNSKKK